MSRVVAIAAVLIPVAWAVAKEPETVQERLDVLAGRKAVLFSELTKAGPKPLVAINAGERFAVGSSFKLYILGTLIDDVNAGKRRDDQIARLKKDEIGPPASEIAEWPIGSPITLHTLSLKMISVSDNTATDMLMHTLGRERIEGMMKTMGHGDPKINRPLLMTREMVMLRDKKAPDRLAKYKKLDEAGRRRMLDTEIAKLHDFEALDFDTASFDTAEWFASPTDMAKALDWIRLNTVKDKPAQDLRDVLTVEKKIKADPKIWTFVGFKGGSEDQIICGNWLLGHRDGRWFTYHVYWNDPKAKVDQKQFVTAIQGIFDSVVKEYVDKK